MDSITNFIAGFAVLVIFIFVALIVVGFLYLGSLSSALKSVSPANRKMSPGQVYLLLIPIFNFIWYFFVVTRIADSFEAEYKNRNLPCENRPTYNIGIAYAIGLVVNIFTSFVPGLNILIMISVFILWMIYWVAVAKHTRILESGAGNFTTYTNQNNSYSPGYLGANNTGYYPQNSSNSNYGGTGNQNGYQGGYSGGHNNPNFNSQNNN
jgi:hypothetical protein